MRNDAGPLPILVAALAVFLLTVMDGFIKSLTPSYPTIVLVTMRFLCGGVVALGVYLAMRAPRITGEAAKAAAIRAVFTIGSAGSFFAALGLLPLAEVIALTFLTPIVLAILGRVFLGEAIGRNVVVAIVLGSAGVFVMLQEQLRAVGAGDQSALGVGLAIFSCFTYAASMIILRSRAGKDPLAVIVLLQSWMPAFMIAPIASAFWVAPRLPDMVVFFVIGTLGTLGHLMLSWAFMRANATRLGVVEYTSLIWAAIIGYVWFTEVPSVWTLAGATLIVCGALAVTRK